MIKLTHNNAIKSVPGRRPSTGRPCQGAAYGWRYNQQGVFMRILLIAASLALTCGCSSSYQQNDITASTMKITKDKSVLIATPADGVYETQHYQASGRMTTMAVQSAFSKFTNSVSVSDECRDIQCLKEKNKANFDYYVIPQILHWEDRATEWSGKPDLVEIKIVIYDASTLNEHSATVLSGKSKWATFGGDHPQDLLSEPITKYVSSLY